MLLVLFLLVAAACGNDKGEGDTKKDDGRSERRRRFRQARHLHRA